MDFTGIYEKLKAIDHINETENRIKFMSQKGLKHEAHM